MSKELPELAGQNLVNFFKLFHPAIMRTPAYVLGLLNLLMYAKAHHTWEQLDEDSEYTRFCLSAFCRKGGFSVKSVSHHLKRLSTGDGAIIKCKSYATSIYVTFTEKARECVQLETVVEHIRYGMNDFYKKNKNVEYKPHPLFLQWDELSAIQKVRGENMQKLFEDDNENNDIKEKDAWAENVVKEICIEAEKENVCIIKKGKPVKVFSHLKNGEFKKQRKGVDTACRLINDLYSGRFFRDNSACTLFGDINENYLELKNVGRAIERIKILKGNQNGIRKFLLKCAKNYFTAIQPGQETYQKLKSSFPVAVRDFILFDDYKGNRIANFLLYYSSAICVKDRQMYETKHRIEESVPQSIYDLLCDYEDYVLEHHIHSYWFNVGKLVKEIKFIIDKGGTSYSMASCFDIVFKKVDDISSYHKKMLPGYFDPEQTTTSDALIEIQDK